jgi:pilus assembly protein CpaF
MSLENIAANPTALLATSLLADSTTTEFRLNGPRRWLVKQGGILKTVPYEFETDQDMIEWVNGILEDANAPARLDGTHWVIEATWRGNGVVARVHVVAPPVSNEVIFTAAKQRTERWTLASLVARRMLDEQVAGFLESAVSARLNMVIAGPMGSGKTTLLQALVEKANRQEMVGVIEEVEEIDTGLPNTLYMRSRAMPSPIPRVEPEALLGQFVAWAMDKSSVAADDLLRGFAAWLRSQPSLLGQMGANEEITLSRLVVETLRMRIDRLIVGEVRGPEAFDLLRAMSLGIGGCLTTLHSDSAKDTLTQLTKLVASHPAHFSPHYITSLVASAVDLIIYLDAARGGHHRIAEVLEVTNRVVDDTTITTEPLFRFDPASDGWERLANPTEGLRMKLAGVGQAAMMRSGL